MNSKSPVPPLDGKLLIADPSLRDGAFNKSVILLAEHSEEDGAFGLVLNHPAGQSVGDLLNGKEFTPLKNVAVHVGGPVSRGHLTFAAFWEREEKFGYAIRISAEEAIAYSNQPGTLVRAFVGYSGWDRDQLEDELNKQAWYHVQPEATLIKEAHDILLWKKLMCQISPYHRVLSGMPDEILAN